MGPKQRFTWAAISAVLLLWAAPLFFSLIAALLPIADTTAWTALLAHPQLWKALALSLVIGSAALTLSLMLAFLLAGSFYGTRHWPSLASFAGASMALPHLAFAIGFAFLVMPSGLLARLIAAFVGWTAPPQWITVQDPLGLSLIAALVLKETPFLLWMLWSFLSRGDAERMFEGQWRVARGLGHSPASVWTRLFIPQIAPRLLWPAVIVWVYGASVVDMALVLGPTQPPTLAVVAWHDLNAAEATLNTRGAVGSVGLTMTLVISGCIAWLLLRAFAPMFRSWVIKGPLIPQPHKFRHRDGSRDPLGNKGKRTSFVPAAPWIPASAGMTVLVLLLSIYTAVIAMLIIMSFSGHWPFPALLPAVIQASAWTAIADVPLPALNSISLAFAAALIALVLAVVWFENASERYDALLIAAAVAALALPQIMIASGQSALFLRLGWSGHYAGVLLAHLAFVFSYVAIILKGPYRAFDPRWRSMAHGLNTSGWRFWWRIKLPLLRPALAAAAAVGFAVSMAQYLPSQLLGEGRITTLTTEAVTLAGSGNRPLTAAFALALAVPTALAFLLAVRLGRSRWGARWN
jgi:putative thiamine transport system permease protein